MRIFVQDLRTLLGRKRSVAPALRNSLALPPDSRLKEPVSLILTVRPEIVPHALLFVPPGPLRSLRRIVEQSVKNFLLIAWLVPRLSRHHRLLELLVTLVLFVIEPLLPFELLLFLLVVKVVLAPLLLLHYALFVDPTSLGNVGLRSIHGLVHVLFLYSLFDFYVIFLLEESVKDHAVFMAACSVHSGPLALMAG